MDGVDVKGAGVQRRKAWFRMLATVALLAVIVVSVGWMAYGWATRMALLHKMLGDGSCSLKNDPATVSRVKAVLPQLLEIHRQAVAECGTATMADLSRMDAFNRRIKSWHAILMAMDVTADATSLAYVEAFVNSDRAIPEEVTSGKDALQKADVRGAGDPSPIGVPPAQEEKSEGE